MSTLYNKATIFRNHSFADCLYRLPKRYIVVFIVSMTFGNPLMGQEDDFIFNDVNDIEEVDAAGWEERYYRSQEENAENIKAKAEISRQAQKKRGPAGQSDPVDQSTESGIENHTDGDRSSNSVLSFNFLHYIIQKFKFSNVMEK